ncbi:hypothetical protein BBJ28_00020340 [Nothophytophthora sp. Chile5]|nr:hypothetical protein BBJ28_00020340 [Nothophytophthora sp. Chile5]
MPMATDSLNLMSLTSQRMDAVQSMMRLGYRCGRFGKKLTTFSEFMAAPATKILDKWFESDTLKATLATDAIIGAKIEDAFLDAQHGSASRRPVIEMNVPTSLDPTIAPPGELFVS